MTTVTNKFNVNDYVYLITGERCPIVSVISADESETENTAQYGVRLGTDDLVLTFAEGDLFTAEEVIPVLRRQKNDFAEQVQSLTQQLQEANEHKSNLAEVFKEIINDAVDQKLNEFLDSSELESRINSAIDDQLDDFACGRGFADSVKDVVSDLNFDIRVSF